MDIFTKKHRNFDIEKFKGKNQGNLIDIQQEIQNSQSIG